MIDTHCHLDQYRSPESVARAAERSGVTVIAVTHLPSHFEQGRAHVAEFKRIRLALGLHPLLAEQHSAELVSFERLLPLTSYVGEIGLDFSRHGRATKDQQLHSFRFVLERLSDRPRFVTLHSRGAEAETLELLEEHGVCGAVFHWFSGPVRVAAAAAERGHYFSVNPAMVLSAKGRELIAALPHERILTETDGPFVRVGRRPATPNDVVQVLRFLSNTWGVDERSTASRIQDNFRGILSVIRQEIR
jgi:TatD DNase family protein